MPAYTIPSRTSLREALPENAMVCGGTRPGTWPTLLVVDSDAEMLHTLVCFFEKRGFHVAASATLAEAKTQLSRRREWSFVIADYHLPDGTGLELFYSVREQCGVTVPVLLMSGSPQGSALCAGTDYLAKPFPLPVLEARVRALLERRG